MNKLYALLSVVGSIVAAGLILAYLPTRNPDFLVTGASLAIVVFGYWGYLWFTNPATWQTRRTLKYWGLVGIYWVTSALSFAGNFFAVAWADISQGISNRLPRPQASAQANPSRWPDFIGRTLEIVLWPFGVQSSSQIPLDWNRPWQAITQLRWEWEIPWWIATLAAMVWTGYQFAIWDGSFYLLDYRIRLGENLGWLGWPIGGAIVFLISFVIRNSIALVEPTLSLGDKIVAKIGMHWLGFIPELASARMLRPPAGLAEKYGWISYINSVVRILLGWWVVSLPITLMVTFRYFPLDARIFLTWAGAGITYYALFGFFGFRKIRYVLTTTRVYVSYPQFTWFGLMQDWDYIPRGKIATIDTEPFYRSIVRILDPGLEFADDRVALRYVDLDKFPL